MVEDGYELMFDRKVVTVFSAPNYCGEFDNAGAMMILDENAVISFKILRPMTHKNRDLNVSDDDELTYRSSQFSDETDEEFDALAYPRSRRVI